MAGYGAWYRLRDEPHDVVLYDKNTYAGGHTTSWTFPPGFTFDEGPHVSFTKDERVREIFADAVNGEFEEVQYQLDNYWHGHWLTHPVQCNLYGLPVDLVTSVITDFVAQTAEPERPIRNYEDWLVMSYGKTFAEEFPAAYTRKYHTTDPRNMTTDWIGPRMYRPSLEEVLRGALAPGAPNVHYVTGFRYPKRGGFADYLRKFIEAAPIVLGHEVVRIDPARKTVQFANGRELEYDGLITSLPLPELIAVMPDAPPDVQDAATRLACSACVLVNVGVARPDISQMHISYFYDSDVLFSRLCFPHLMAPDNAPPGTSSVQAEVYFSRKYKPLEGKPEDLIEPVIEDLVRCGVFDSSDEVLYKGAVRCEYANIIFDHDRSDALETVHGYLAELGIAPCGRYGDWGYMWTDDAFKSGERAAEAVLARVGEKEELGRP
ncbi:MAG: FAD-dependent oxidoreductase [Actinobacteria bacterium]|nr:FAD-dependent oxidoreductase [Actinomycetota bacterium]